MKTKIFKHIDSIIEKVNNYKVEPIFSNEIQSRNNRKVSNDLSENEIIEIFTTLIAYSQNANSKLVERVINTGIFNKIFADFDIDKIVDMNPCDLADEYWGEIGGIRQQAKLFHIVSLARKIKKIGSFNKLLTETEIPKIIKTENDIDDFWVGFKTLKKIMEVNKVPFFRSTTSLLHFLLETGYDCVKPDLVIMKVAKKIGIVENESGDKNLVQTVRTIQEYSIDRKIRPSVIDLYFLIDEGQLGAKKFVKDDFYN
jgi:3-methyladenine DNA glycosylase Tag